MTIAVTHTIYNEGPSGTAEIAKLFKDGFVPSHFRSEGLLEPDALESHLGDEAEAFLCEMVIAKPDSAEEKRHIRFWVKPGEIEIEVIRLQDGDLEIDDTWTRLDVKRAEVNEPEYVSEADYPYLQLTIYLDFGPGAGEYHIIVCERAVASGWAQVEQKTF